MDMANLRKLRLLFEDFPKNHNLILIGQPSLLATLDLGVNQDIKSRVTYSVITKRLGPDAMRDFILRELDRVGLGHNTFTAARRRPDRSLRRRRPAQGPQPLRRLHDRGRPLRQQNHRHRQRQPRPLATPLAKGSRPRRLLTVLSTRQGRCEGVMGVRTTSRRLIRFTLLEKP